jgi:hypothetical protein
MARGAEKYGERNWEQGIPVSRFYASALRHLMQWREGDSQEDHLAAVLFNVGGIMFTRARVAAGALPAELDDGPSDALPPGVRAVVCRCGVTTSLEEFAEDGCMACGSKKGGA